MHTYSCICMHNLTVKGTWQDVISMADTQGVITPADVRNLGLAPENLSKLVAKGLLVRTARGVYERSGRVPTESHSYVEIAKTVPKGVICLLSALQIHGIGSSMPWEVWVAIPRGQRRPKERTAALRVITMSGDNYELDAVSKTLEGVQVRVYGLEKTIIDCFRLRHLVGHDVPVEALRESIRERRIDPGHLISLASKLRSRRLIEPYLDAII